MYVNASGFWFGCTVGMSTYLCLPVNIDCCCLYVCESVTDSLVLCSLCGWVLSNFLINYKICQCYCIFTCVWDWSQVNSMCLFVAIHLSVESLLIILSWSGHLSEQLSLALRNGLIHTVQLKPSPVINDTFWTWKHTTRTKKCPENINSQINITYNVQLKLHLK